jgi:hypothetical protein
MADDQVLTVVCGSGDASVISGKPSDFTVRLAIPITLTGRWEAICKSVSFPKPKGNNSVFVYLDSLEDSSIGSQAAPLLMRTRPIRSDDESVVFIEETSTVLAWKQVRDTVLQTLHFRIEESDGTPVPNKAYSIVELALRKVSDRR